jgi:hypothetical protein
MRPIFKFVQATLLLSCCATATLGQAPDMGSTIDYVLFSSNGAVTNTGISHLTGNVGCNVGAVAGFGNVNGVMHNNDASTVLCATDLLVAYLQLDAAIPDYNVAPLLGNGDTLAPGVYLLNGASVLNGELVLDGMGLANTTYIFQIEGAFSVNAGAKIKLINGAMACNIFWKVEGMINVAAGCTIRGSFIANNAAISLNAGDTLEGRVLSTTGAVSIDGVEAYTPIGCGIPALTGPPPPAMGTVECYAIFSSNGTVSNTGVTIVEGDVGTNNGVTVGFDPLLVLGTVHIIPDASTSDCAADLATLYDTLDAMVPDIELLYPTQFGGNLLLTPHVYLLDAATTLTGTLYLDAQGNTNAVFVILINGTFLTSPNANVVLCNGARAQNVYWKVEGSVTVNDNSTLVGTLVINDGATNVFSTGVTLYGRAVATSGTMSTNTVHVAIPTVCSVLDFEEEEAIVPNVSVTPRIGIGPNPFEISRPLYITLGEDLQVAELRVFDGFGKQVMFVSLREGTTQLATEQLGAGMYFYRLSSTGRVVQTGSLMALH